nr:MAG TPA: hypothetical protein [Caudoviricetes sp.]
MYSLDFASLVLRYFLFQKPAVTENNVLSMLFLLFIQVFHNIYITFVMF